MPYKDPEKIKEYIEKNKEKRKEYIKKYEKTDRGVKLRRIRTWRRLGVISEDYNKLYDYYLSIEECQNCGIELNQDYSTRKCLDHDHNTGQFRQVLCNICNVMRDKQRNELGQFI